MSSGRPMAWARRSIIRQATMRSIGRVVRRTDALEPNAVGVLVTRLPGAVGAAVAISSCFLRFLRAADVRQTRMIEDFRDFHAQSQRKFQDQIDRSSDRQEQLQRGFEDQVNRITESHNTLLREVILAMRWRTRADVELPAHDMMMEYYTGKSS
jgi:phosphate uptake regulator